jgi:hypothetical protein
MMICTHAYNTQGVSNLIAEVVDGARGITLAAQSRQCKQARIIPAANSSDYIISTCETRLKLKNIKHVRKSYLQ